MESTMDDAVDEVAATRQTERRSPPASQAAIAGDDLLSGICDDVLVRILGLAEHATDAVRRGVLSRRWRGLWRRAPSLRFSSRRWGFIVFVNDTLDLRARPAAAAAGGLLEHLEIRLDDTRGATRAAATACSCSRRRPSQRRRGGSVTLCCTGSSTSFHLKLDLPYVFDDEEKGTRVMDLGDLPAASAKLEAMHLFQLAAAPPAALYEAVRLRYHPLMYRTLNVDETKPTASCDDDHADRISTLPDDVLVSILRLVGDNDATELVRTGALSRRWRGLWTRVAALRFDAGPEHLSPGDAERFIAFVDGVLARHAKAPAGPGIEQLGIFLNLHYTPGEPHVPATTVEAAQGWVRAKELVLDTGTLMELTMYVMDGMESLELRAPNLRVLKVESCDELERLKVSASSLEHLVFSRNGLRLGTIDDVDLPCVRSLWISLVSHMFQDSDINDTGISLLKKCSSATSLVVELDVPWEYERRVDVVKDKIPQLPNVTSLAVKIHPTCERHSFGDGVAGLLTRLNNPRYLLLQLDEVPGSIKMVGIPKVLN
ncbi:hypothetical protein HU200_012965 [Digitaria exilis]|uniref:F-box domain-containing protein n=1 Tax=Digitaria exilis TaxID=1010633 RepID=A0A835FF95_9POAL|nr:hypothetical protein HU200_012965 [Digitaria exilis]